MQKLIEKVMTWNKYPNQDPAWEGWEYVAKTKAKRLQLAKILGYDMDGGLYAPTTACIQIDGSRYVIEVDGYVWETTRKNFKGILEKLENT